MNPRALLFVPGDRPDRMEKALASGADALILDLEDAVAPAAKPVARAAVAKFLQQAPRDLTLLVRINPLQGDLAEADLDAIVAAAPDGIVLPKAEGAASVEALDRLLEAVGLAALPVLPIATETPAAIFELGSFRTIGHRLIGLNWGAEDLPASIGAATSREDDGRFTPPYQIARALTLFAAHAAGVAAIETVYPAFRDVDGFTTYAARAVRDGFTSMMAIHPTQVAIINAAFCPAETEVAAARRVVEAFDAAPDAGVLQIDGKMIDAPHLKQARRILERAAASRLG